MLNGLKKMKLLDKLIIIYKNIIINLSNNRMKVS